MDYAYVAYTEDRRLVKGKLSATNEEPDKAKRNNNVFSPVGFAP